MSAEIAASPGAVEPLGSYVPGESALIATPERSVLASGVHSTLPAELAHGRPAELAARARAALAAASAEGAAPVLVGALPFAGGAPAHIYVPERLTPAGPVGAGIDAGIEAVTTGDPAVTLLPEPEVYRRSVAAALELIGSGTLRKVVLARSIRVTAGAIDLPALLRNLALADPWARIFAIDLPPTDAGPRTLVGASPELLVRRRGREVSAQPLAGSVPRHPDPLEDARRAASLLASEKDRDEHRVAVTGLRDALEPLCEALEVPASPELVRTGSLWHLATRLRGRLRDPATCSLTLAATAHPTPAVCGTPTTAAHAAIGELEPFDRGFYAGAVGWQDRHGDGEWTLAIRCGEVGEDSITLWAGAGIVAGSNPEDELAETSAKCRALLDAIGVEAGL